MSRVYLSFQTLVHWTGVTFDCPKTLTFRNPKLMESMVRSIDEWSDLWVQFRISCQKKGSEYQSLLTVTIDTTVLPPLKYTYKQKLLEHTCWISVKFCSQSYIKNKAWGFITFVCIFQSCLYVCIWDEKLWSSTVSSFRETRILWYSNEKKQDSTTCVTWTWR
jgi:hypothetical protein